MKKYFFGLLMLSASLSASAQEKADTLYYDKDGHGVESKELSDYYRIVDGSRYETFQINGAAMSAGKVVSIDKDDDRNSRFEVTIGLLPTAIRDYGKQHVLNLTIANNTQSPIEFDPASDITAESLKTRTAESTELKVYTSEEILKKYDKRSAIGSAFVNLSGGLAIIDAGFPDKSGKDLGQYDPFGQFLQWEIEHSDSRDYENNISEARDVYSAGYLKKATIQPGEVISGFVYVERIKGNEITAKINLAGEVYTFTWNY